MSLSLMWGDVASAQPAKYFSAKRGEGVSHNSAKTNKQKVFLVQTLLTKNLAKEFSAKGGYLEKVRKIVFETLRKFSNLFSRMFTVHVLIHIGYSVINLYQNANSLVITDNPPQRTECLTSRQRQRVLQQARRRRKMKTRLIGGDWGGSA